MSGADRPLSPALELSVYRVVQEALTNVVKHAPGARAAVDLAVYDNVIRLDVTDDGGPAVRPADARAASRAGPRDRRDARADRRVRRLAPRRAAGRLRLPGDRPGPDRGRGVTTRVLVVDDQALLRTAFSSLIDAEDDLEVVGEAADGRQAVELAAKPGAGRHRHGRPHAGAGRDPRRPVRSSPTGSGCVPPGTHPHHLRPGRVRLRGAAGRGERVRAEEPPARGTAERDPHRRRRRGAPGPERDAPPHRALHRGRPAHRRRHPAAWTSSPSASARCSRWSPAACPTPSSPRRCT